MVVYAFFPLHSKAETEAVELLQVQGNSKLHIVVWEVLLYMVTFIGW